MCLSAYVVVHLFIVLFIGERYTAGFSQSLLVAAPRSGAAEHFQLCTPDHIFPYRQLR